MYAHVHVHSGVANWGLVWAHAQGTFTCAQAHTILSNMEANIGDIDIIFDYDTIINPLLNMFVHMTKLEAMVHGYTARHLKEHSTAWQTDK